MGFPPTRSRSAERLPAPGWPVYKGNLASILDPARAWPRMVANMAGVFSCLARRASNGHALELDGVTAAVVPACAARSVVNCVTYSRAEALATQLERIAHEYDRAGVRAWTVWVPEQDREAARLLEGAGHVLDARPAAMVRSLEGIAPPGVDLDLMEPDMAAAARVNDQAYGFPGDFERAFQSVPPEPAHLYLVRSDGVPACTVLTYEEHRECGIYLVATLPEARGRGLATALMAHALIEARGRGSVTSSLQATARGRPIYERLGYRDIGTVHMWERRRAE
jgi:GNAT superfamily N-acetyltransferase